MRHAAWEYWVNEICLSSAVAVDELKMPKKQSRHCSKVVNAAPPFWKEILCVASLDRSPKGHSQIARHEVTKLQDVQLAREVGGAAAFKFIRGELWIQRPLANLWASLLRIVDRDC